MALACNIAEMYLRVELDPKDRACLQFLWRDMDMKQKPDKYEFNRLVFGINSSPFLAQFVSHSMLNITRGNILEQQKSS